MRSMGDWGASEGTGEEPNEFITWLTKRLSLEGLHDESKEKQK